MTSTVAFRFDDNVTTSHSSISDALLSRHGTSANPYFLLYERQDTRASALPLPLSDRNTSSPPWPHRTPSNPSSQPSRHTKSDLSPLSTSRTPSQQRSLPLSSKPATPLPKTAGPTSSSPTPTSLRRSSRNVETVPKTTVSKATLSPSITSIPLKNVAKRRKVAFPENLSTRPSSTAKSSVALPEVSTRLHSKSFPFRTAN